MKAINSFEIVLNDWETFKHFLGRKVVEVNNKKSENETLILWNGTVVPKYLDSNEKLNIFIKSDYGKCVIDTNGKFLHQETFHKFIKEQLKKQ